MKQQLNIYLTQYWGYLALVLWVLIALAFNLVRLDSYGIEEQAARALLLNWSVSDNIVNPVVIFGVPDFRALLFIPIGTYWAGSMLAAKIFSLAITFIAVTVLYRWASKTFDRDSALIAAALLLIAPVTLIQVDSMGAGPYLLLGLGAVAWLDFKYRQKPRYFGGWYFSIMLLTAVLVTIHPMGFAAPIGLALYWLRNPDTGKKSRHLYIGLLIAAILGVLLSNSWTSFQLMQNPIASLSSILDGATYWLPENPSLVTGLLVALVAGIIVLFSFSFLTSNIYGILLLTSLFIGLLQADRAWSMVVIAITLFAGLALLGKLNDRAKGNGFLAKRGLTALIAFILCTSFMLQAKAHSIANQLQILSPEDELIEQLAAKASDKDKAFRAASQWPGRTMLACKRDILPLPPEVSDIETFRKITLDLTHLIFDPFKQENKHLADHLSNMISETETSVYLTAGVIIDVLKHKVELRDARPKLENKNTIKTGEPDPR